MRVCVCLFLVVLLSTTNNRGKHDGITVTSSGGEAKKRGRGVVSPVRYNTVPVIHYQRMFCGRARTGHKGGGAGGGENTQRGEKRGKK